ncbi:MAG TPA: hypothetical protein VF629_14750 [Hymenobacter sp.]|jgi:hypothetical protein|uniref:hypothetical protein n=1 Tax=Hymenobacter sp. TaxID=1898978 RepID=UPI002EDA5FC7
MEQVFSNGLSQVDSVLASEQGRQRVLKAALRITENTPIAPNDYERMLLDQFVVGQLTIDQVVAQLEARQSA